MMKHLLSLHTIAVVNIVDGIVPTWYNLIYKILMLCWLITNYWFTDMLCTNYRTIDLNINEGRYQGLFSPY